MRPIESYPGGSRGTRLDTDLRALVQPGTTIRYNSILQSLSFYLYFILIYSKQLSDNAIERIVCGAILLDSRHDPGGQPGGDDETGTLPNLPDVTTDQSPAANRTAAPATALLRGAIPEEQRPTHPVVRLLRPATHSAIG